MAEKKRKYTKRQPAKKPIAKRRKKAANRKVNSAVKYYWSVYRALKEYYASQGYPIEAKMLRRYASDTNKFLEANAKKQGKQRDKEIEFFIGIIEGGTNTKIQRQELFDEILLPFPEVEIDEPFYYWELEEKTLPIPRNVDFIIDYTLIEKNNAIFQGTRKEIPHQQIVEDINQYVRNVDGNENYYVFVPIELRAEGRTILLTLETRGAIEIPRQQEAEKEKPDKEREKEQEIPEEEKRPQEKGDDVRRKERAEADKAEIEKLYALLNGKIEEQAKVLDVIIKKQQAGMPNEKEKQRIEQLENEIEQLRTKIDKLT